MTNIGIFPTLAGEGDIILSDQFNHASVIDACRLSRAKRQVVKHMNMKDLEWKLKAAVDEGYDKKFFVSEGVFSMEGDIAPLKEIVRICKKYGAHVIVDDCHGIGVLGKTGRGSTEYNGVEMKDICLLIGTLSKGLGGGTGGYVCGKYEVIRFLT